MIWYEFSWRRRKPPVKCVFRQTPVPYVGGSGKYGRYFRRPKTTQEKRWSLAHSDFVRGKRNAINLPDPWDDQPRYIPTCWKDCTKKRKQWMK